VVTMSGSISRTQQDDQVNVGPGATTDIAPGAVATFRVKW
jgi:hypothetical protein